MKDLILVESPTKAKTLYKFLSGKYNIEASLGHIRDLPKSKLGIEIDNNFEPSYVIPQKKRKTVEELKNKVKDVKNIILATDPDREGEAIAYHLYEVLKNETNKNAEFKRIVFHEITQDAISKAILHPRDIDKNLVSSQTARRVLDRIVGYQLSPILWEKIKRRLSAGRVQSIALRFIAEREKEITKFKKKEYYRFSVTSSKDKASIEFALTKINNENIEKQETFPLYDGEYRYSFTILNKEKSEIIEKNIQGKNLKVTDIGQKETKKSPYPPFTTSILQQEAYRRLNFSSKRSMSLAQRLYEEGFITYHRTDSFNMSNEFITNARKHISKTFGKSYLSDSPRLYKTKSKIAQEAHEAIRPTRTESDEEEINKTLGKDFSALYKLIYRRAIATQMSDAIYASTKISAEAISKENYFFEANGRILKFAGYLKLWFFEEEEQDLPQITINDNLLISEIKISTQFTNPPPRYNEASLIATLEKHGIGRPSTYAPIISTISERDYVEKQEGKFVPTLVGIAVNNFLVENFSEIDDIPFTANMEDQLDEIANGQRDWVPMIKDFYKPFKEKLNLAEKKDKIELEIEKTGEKCPECGGDIVVRRSRFGKFYACNNFPKCKYKASYTQETDYTCPKDEGKIIIKKTRKGRIFYGCSNYPKCDFAVWNKDQLEKELQNK